jgi:hypothetical protein
MNGTERNVSGTDREERERRERGEAGARPELLMKRRIMEEEGEDEARAYGSMLSEWDHG